MGWFPGFCEGLRERMPPPARLGVCFSALWPRFPTPVTDRINKYGFHRTLEDRIHLLFGIARSPDLGRETTSNALANEAYVLFFYTLSSKYLTERERDINFNRITSPGTADIIKQKPSTAFVQSKSPKIRQSSSKRTTRSRSQSNNQIETEVREETELKPVLSPLAARAALASLVHELPEKSCYFSGGEEFLKLKDSQQSDGTGVTELSALEATSNSVKSTCNHQIRVLLPTNSSKIKDDYTSIEVTNPPITSSNSHGTSNLSANQEKEMEASRDYKAIIPQNSNLENGEKTKIPTSTRITRSQQIKPEVTFLGAEPANSRNSVFDKGSFSKSPCFQVEELSSNDDEDMEGSLTKKSPGLTIGTGRRIPTKQRKKCSSNIDMSTETGNKANEIGSHEVKGKKFISTHVDSTSETDSTAQRNELATKKRRRVSCKYSMGSDIKNEENHETAKKNRVSSKKALKATPARSSPRLACPLRTR
ncbi:hypothetical protein KSP40_PGU009006 [Platanthera guangdongensis]|uniref:Uncharacterized protein n=1 Tax=Platanthera guangdongensis TaxID=2320717 RepID=A0ABR2MCN3_9ASPA